MTDKMTLDEFRATGVDCDDLGKALSDRRWDGDGPPGRGRLYLGTLYIEWARLAGGDWYLTLGNLEWVSDDLLRLEALLYEWALENGYADE